MKNARLYVCGHGRTLRWCVASSMKDAKANLQTESVRVPDPDDIRHFWNMSGIAALNANDQATTFGVSRQTVNNWRRKGNLKTVTQERIASKANRCRMTIRTMPGLSICQVASMLRMSPKKVAEIAQECGMDIPFRMIKRKMPTDDELLRMADGRTWREFADVAGVRMATLRHYIYAHPELAEAIRRVRKPVVAGRSNIPKLDLKKARALGKKGATAYTIAEQLKCEMMTIRAHLQRWGKESPDEFYEPYGTRPRIKRSGRVVAGSDGRKPEQS